jgi:tetratricopeptide (TPR) repeat protein
VIRSASPEPTSRKAEWAWAALFLASAIVHVVVWWQYRADPFATTLVSDALSYDRWAARIAQDGLAAEPVFHQSPLFPLLLAPIYALASEPVRVTWSIGLQVLLGSLAIACLVPLGRLWFGSRSAGVAAAVLALAHAPFVFYAMKLLPVPLALATQSAGLLTLAVARRRPMLPIALGAGAVWGLACLARSEMLLFVPFALAALVWRAAPHDERPRRTVPLLVAYLAGVVLVVAPVTLHNVRQGDFVVIASSGGENLFIGNQRGGGGGYHQLDPGAGDIFSQRAAAKRLAEEARGESLRPSQISAYWRQRALREIGEDPGAWLALEGKKLVRLLHPGDPTDVYSFALERDAYVTALYALPVTPWVLLLLGAVGGTLAFRGRAAGSLPCLALVAVHSVVLLTFFVDNRLRLPLLFALCPLAGFAIIEAVRRWRSGASRRWLVLLAGGVVAALIVGAAATRPTPRDVVRLASVLSLQQRLDDSLEVLAPQLDRPDPHPLVLDQAGWVRQKRGDFAQARDHYLAALDGDLEPRRARQTRTRLAMVHEHLGELDAAASQHDAAVASGYASAGTFYERGMFRLRRNDLRGAVQDLREAARLDPRWPAPRQALRSLGAR